MKRLMYCVMMLVAILNGETTLTRTQALASYKGNPLVALGFNRCEGQPCFLGVIPGKTSWQDAGSILLKHGFTKGETDFTFDRAEPVQGGIYVARVPDKPDVVNSIEFGDLSQKYKVILTDVLDLYGFPYCVQSDYKGSFWFAYPNMLINAFSSDDRKHTNASVNFVYIVDPQLPISSSGIRLCEKVEYSTEYLLWFTQVI